MGAPNEPVRIGTITNSNGVTQYSDIIRATPGEIISLQVAHPAATTTTYTLEGSNTPPGVRGDGPTYTNAVFCDVDARNKDNVALAAAAKSAAVNFPIEFRATMDLYRLKMVGGAGTGVITVDRQRGNI